MSMVTLEETLRQLRLVSGDDDTRVEELIVEAEDWAVQVMGANYDEDWTEETTPGSVKTAIKMRVHGLYDSNDDMLKVADRLIDRWRDHVAS